MQSCCLRHIVCSCACHPHHVRMTSTCHLQTCMSSAHHLHGQYPGKNLPKVKEIRLISQKVKEIRLISWLTWHLLLKLQRGKTCLLCSANDMSSSIGADDMSSNRSADDMSSGRCADDMSSSRGANDMSQIERNFPKQADQVKNNMYQKQAQKPN